MSRVIAIANQKGGVGKTTTAINLGASLAAAEKRTLVIDMDPQGNATSGLGVDTRAAKGSLYGVLLDHYPVGAAVVRSVHLPLLDVIPATTDLAGAEIDLVNLPQREMRLRRAVDTLRDLYDYVLIDCPPSLGLLTLNVLVAADEVLVPLQAEFFALEGLARFSEMVELIRQHLSPRLHVGGVLLTLFDARLNLSHEVAAEVRSTFAGQVCRTTIPRNVRLAEAPSFGKPVLLYDAASVGAQAYLALAGEIMGGAHPRGAPRLPPGSRPGWRSPARHEP